MKRLALLVIVALFLFTIARAQELHRRPTEEERIQKLEDAVKSLERKVYALCVTSDSFAAVNACAKN